MQLAKMSLFIVILMNLVNYSKMARQILAAPTSSASVERLFSAAGKMHDGLKKTTLEDTFEDMLTVAKNFPDA